MYIQTGVVRFGYFHFALIARESQRSGEASECAAEQDAFWEYHDLLFESRTDPERGNFTDKNLKRFAEELGLDTAAFDECLDSDRYKDTVRGQTTTARKLGVMSTPTFVINGMPLIGGQPFEVFQQIIENEK
jgi:protein-disulfide isomerase